MLSSLFQTTEKPAHLIYLHQISTWSIRHPWTFREKVITTFSRLICLHKRTIADVWSGPKFDHLISINKGYTTMCLSVISESITQRICKIRCSEIFVLVNICLGGWFGINCLTAFLKKSRWRFMAKIARTK